MAGADVHGREAVTVVGGGPAGLAVAGALRRRGVDALVLERGEGVGASWRGRYARLRLNTVRWMSHLPGQRMPRRLGRWVSRDEYVGYLEDYVVRQGLRVRTACEVERIDGGPPWRLRLLDGSSIRSDAVVVATGFDREQLPVAWPGVERFGATVVHAGDYIDAARLPGERVVVAGTGASGMEIAVDLATAGRAVTVACRTPPNHLPRELLGLPLTPLGVADDWTPTAVGDALGGLLQRAAYGDLSSWGLPPAPRGMSSVHRRTGKGPVVVDGFCELLRAGRISVVDAVERLEPGAVITAGGRRVGADALVAATGYRRGLEPLVGHLGALDDDGEPGRTLPELHFVGYRVPLTGQLRAQRIDARRLARTLAGTRLRDSGWQRCRSAASRWHMPQGS